MAAEPANSDVDPASGAASGVQPSDAQYMFVDIDLDLARERHARAAAFVHATSLKYGLSSNDLRQLGGSELPRVPDFFALDHDWAGKGEITLRRSQARLVLRLFSDVPLAVENFTRLCRGKEKDPKMTYRGCKFHRVVPDFIAQTGDFIFGNGTGGESVFTGRKFKDEKRGLQRKHDRIGVLSMGNSGKNSNTSQWFLTLAPAPHLDGKHVVFGELVSGFDCLAEIAAAAQPDGGEPAVPIHVTECGDWRPGQDPGAGFWFDVPDPDSFAGSTPVFMAFVRVGLVAPSPAVRDRFAAELQACQVVDGGADAAQAMASLLASHAVDVVLVAPACAGSVASDGASAPDTIVAKPVDAMAALRAWAAKKSAGGPVGDPGWSSCCWDALNNLSATC